MTGRLPTITESVKPAPYLDVTGDGNLTVLDAIRVINEISRPSQAEPESNDQALLDVLNDI